MSYSANEVQALATKAARGAGAPAGQAAEFGRAAVVHLTRKRDPQMLAAALEALPAGPILELPLAIAALLEQAEAGAAIGGVIPCAHPDLAQSYVQALGCAQNSACTAKGVAATLHPETPREALPLRRLDLADDFAAKLEALAAKTFVPESEASRLAGAGAGLTDND